MRGATWFCGLLLVGVTGCGGEESSLGPDTLAATTGTIRVAVQVVGGGGDFDGFDYKLVSPDTTLAPVTANNGDLRTFTRLPAGTYSFSVSHLAEHCERRPAGRSVILAPGAIVDVRLTLHCVGEILYGEWLSSNQSIVRYLDAAGQDKILRSGGWNKPLGWSPDGQWFAVEHWGDDCQVWIDNVNGSERTLEAGILAKAKAPAWSPDGKWFVAEEWESCGATAKLITALFDNVSGERLGYIPDPHTGPGMTWSPDSRKVAYFDFGSVVRFPNVLKTYDIIDGVFDTIADLAPAGAHCTLPKWSPRGTVIAASCAAQSLYLFSVATGEVAEVTPRDLKILQPSAWSPDGSKFGFTGHSANESAVQVYYYDVDNDSIVQLTEIQSTGPSWSSDGEAAMVASWRDGRAQIRVLDLEWSKERLVTEAAQANPAYWRPSSPAGELMFPVGPWAVPTAAAPRGAISGGTLLAQTRGSPRVVVDPGGYVEEDGPIYYVEWSPLGDSRVRVR